MQINFTDILEAISKQSELTDDEAEGAMRMILSGEVSSDEISAFLMGMRLKGTTVREVTSFVRVMRDVSVKVDVKTDGAVDLCGTGGDKSGTFNISTAAMFVTAGAGIPVLKHGNRSVSSKSGSYDVLEELGAVPNLKKKEVEALFRETGMAFMFAPNFHPALRYVMPARRALKIRTFFNMLGPLLNPASVQFQLIGAFSSDAASQMAQILKNLNSERAFTLYSHDGLDEVSTTAKADMFEVYSKNEVEKSVFDPVSAGFKPATLEELMGGDAKKNADIIRAIFENRSTDAQRNIVILNSAFSIYVTGAYETLQESILAAEKSIGSGEALRKMNLFISESQKLADF